MGRRQLFLSTILAGANLPTVWAHVITGWWLAGSGGHDLPTVLFGVSLIFLAGSLKNPEFDNPPDPAFERARRFAPRLSYDARWRWSWTLFALGVAVLFAASVVSGVTGFVLACAILAYHWNSRNCWQAPLYLGVARGLVYVLGGAIGAQISGAVLWSGIALGIFFAGIHYLARTQYFSGLAKFWPCLLLLAPIFLAYLVNQGEYRNSGLLLSAVLILWVLRCLRPFFWSPEPRTPPEWGALVPGLVLVDWLAVADGPRLLSVGLLALFFTALLFQKQRVSSTSAGVSAALL